MANQEAMATYAEFVIANFANYRAKDFQEGGKWAARKEDLTKYGHLSNLYGRYIEWHNNSMPSHIKNILKNIQNKLEAQKENHDLNYIRRKTIAALNTDLPINKRTLPEQNTDELIEDVTDFVNLMTPDEYIPNERILNFTNEACRIYSDKALLGFEQCVIKNYTLSGTAKFVLRNAQQIGITKLNKLIGERKKLFSSRGILSTSANFEHCSDILQPIICTAQPTLGTTKLNMPSRPTISQALEMEPLLCNEQKIVLSIWAYFLIKALIKEDLVPPDHPIHKDLEKYITQDDSLLRMLIQGQPGSGKSEVILRFEIFAYHWNASNRIAVVSYMCRAALNLSTEYHTASTICGLFAINPLKQGTDDTLEKRTLLINNIHDIHFLIIDEIWTTPNPLFTKIISRGREAKNDDERSLLPSFNVVLIGDINQHGDVHKQHLYKGSTDEKQNRLSEHSSRHRRYIRQFQDVIIFQKQHRFKCQKLVEFHALLTKPIVERSEIVQFLEELNNTYDPEMYKKVELHPYKILVLRNDVRTLLNRKAIKIHAKQAHKQLFVWSSNVAVDPKVPKKFHPELVALFKEQKPQDLQNINPLQYFFEGIEYAINKKEANIHSGLVKNNLAVGVGIEIHPEDYKKLDSSETTIFLNHVPLAIYVRPKNVTFQERGNSNEYFPVNAFPITPLKKTVHLTLPEPILIEKQMSYTIDALIYGYDLGDGYALTDFFLQGSNIKNDLWFLHLNFPPSGALTRESLVVAITRFTKWDDIHLLCPLWNSAQEKNQVIEKYHKNVALRHEDINSELDRIKMLSLKTRSKYKILFDKRFKNED